MCQHECCPDSGPFQLCCLRVSKLGWVSRFSACKKVLNHASGAQVFFALALRPGGMRAPQIGGFCGSVAFWGVFASKRAYRGFFLCGLLKKPYTINTVKNSDGGTQGKNVRWGAHRGKIHCKGGIWLFEEHTVVNPTVLMVNGFLRKNPLYAPFARKNSSKSHSPAKTTNLRWPI